MIMYENEEDAPRTEVVTMDVTWSTECEESELKEKYSELMYFLRANDDVMEICDLRKHYEDGKAQIYGEVDILVDYDMADEQWQNILSIEGWEVENNIGKPKAVSKEDVIAIAKAMRFGKPTISNETIKEAGEYLKK